jgi:uncharacterized protein
VKRRPVAIPQLFLGLVAIGAAVVLTAHITAGAIHDVRHRGDTITVTGSAKKPITANLVRWAVTVEDTASTAAPAAVQLHADLADVEKFLRAAGLPQQDMSLEVVETEQQVDRPTKHTKIVTYRVYQTIDVTTQRIDAVERVSTRLGDLIERGIDVSAEPLAYISTHLTQAKFDALAAATVDARRRAEILVQGLGSHLGRMRSSSLGVYQITPRDSTEVSDYGVNDTSTRDKDVTAVVSATFNVS